MPFFFFFFCMEAAKIKEKQIDQKKEENSQPEAISATREI